MFISLSHYLWLVLHIPGGRRISEASTVGPGGLVSRMNPLKMDGDHLG